MNLSSAIKVVNILTAVAVVAAAAAFGLFLFSLTQVGVAPGQVRMEATGTAAELVVPIVVSNNGRYPISGVQIVSTVRDGMGEVLAAGSTGPLTINAGQRGFELTHRLGVDLERVKPETLKRLVFNDETLDVSVQAGFAVEPFLKFSLSASAPFRWGAPVSGLKMEEPELLPHNQSHILVRVPVSFSNNSPFMPINMQLRVTVFDAQGRVRGGGALEVNAPPNSAFSDSVNLYLSVPREEAERLLFSDSVLDYRVVLEGFYAEDRSFTFEQRVSYDWGAPLADFRIGSLSLSSHNATALKFELPVSFENRNRFVDLDATLAGEVLGANGERVSLILPQSLHVPSGASFTGRIEGFLDIKAATAQPFTLRLVFQTVFGEVLKEVALTA